MGSARRGSAASIRSAGADPRQYYAEIERGRSWHRGGASAARADPATAGRERGHVSIRKLPDGRYEWRHRVDGKHRKKTFARRADAVAHDSQVRADLARGAHVDLTDKTTVAEYFRQWWHARVLRPNTVEAYTGFLRNHLEPLPLGSRPLVKVRPSEIQAWARDRASPRPRHAAQPRRRAAGGVRHRRP